MTATIWPMSSSPTRPGASRFPPYRPRRRWSISTCWRRISPRWRRSSEGDRLSCGPHAKTHRAPAIARLQVAAGADGITAPKVERGRGDGRRRDRRRLRRQPGRRARRRSSGSAGWRSGRACASRSIAAENVADLAAAAQARRRQPSTWWSRSTAGWGDVASRPGAGARPGPGRRRGRRGCASPGSTSTRGTSSRTPTRRTARRDGARCWRRRWRPATRSSATGWRCRRHLRRHRHLRRLRRLSRRHRAPVGLLRLHGPRLPREGARRSSWPSACSAPSSAGRGRPGRHRRRASRSWPATRRRS